MAARSSSFGTATQPPMLTKLFIAIGLVAFCVAIHAIHAMGLIAVLQWLKARLVGGTRGFWPPAWSLIRVAAWAVLLHLLQILVWAALYAWHDAMPDLTTAAYFSAVTYTTTGYGDLVLPKDWRLVGGVEALTGILMCGLSTGMFFAVFSQIFGLRSHPAPDS